MASRHHTLTVKGRIPRESSASEDTCDIFNTEPDSTCEDYLSDETTATMNTEDLILKKAKFVAIWGPANDILFLTHPNSDCGSFMTAKADIYPQDPISDIHCTLGVPSVTPSTRSSYCFILQETEERLDCDERSLKGITQTSSTLGGLDVYLKGQALSYTHLHQPAYSVLDFSTDFNFDPRYVSSGEINSDDPCLFRRSGLLLNTSGSIVGEERFSGSWSTVESPTEEEIESMKRQPEATRPRGRRLKKKRPLDDSCLTAAKEQASKEVGVIAEVESPVQPQKCCHDLAPRTKKIFKGLLNIGNLKRRAMDQGWIWVET